MGDPPLFMGFWLIQLLAGRTGQEGQEHNQRKNCKGVFWEDRYHATAVEKDDHLFRCLVYIDLNMVHAGKENVHHIDFTGG